MSLNARAKWSLLMVCLLVYGGVAGVRSDDEIRRSVWSGKFYPAKVDELLGTITHLTRQADLVKPKLPSNGVLKALILPHAGYRYSGLTAAHAGHVLKNKTYGKVILVGPDHRVGFENGAISKSVWWETPLGKIALHPDGNYLLETGHLFKSVTESDRKEHSLEVLLPFLQFYLDDFKIVPIVLGPCLHDRVAAAVELILDQKTLVVVSADLSHYLSYEQAKQKDRETIQHILSLDSRPILSDENTSCGKYPIAVLIHLARKRRWKPVLLNYTNSGDTAGDRKRVVGYAAIAFYGERSMSSSEQIPEGLTQTQGQALVALARNTLMEKFNRKISKEERKDLQARLQDSALQEKCGTFVTLKIGGQLRGCIGSLVGRQSLVEGVRSNALNAAFHDPRFRSLSNKELARVSIEVSVLTEPRPLEYSDAADLVARLRPGVDGVTLRKGPAGATFLPQVWEQLPLADKFLSHLCAKAGLPAEAWREGDLEVETYQVQYFEEPH